MEYGDLVRLRSAVRTYAAEAVEQEKLEYVLECARLAPSWANKQGWSFVVVRDAATVAALVAASSISRWSDQRGPPPAVVVACGDPVASGQSRGIAYWIVDVAIAMEHLVLAATDAGLGTCWIGVLDEEEIKQTLAIPEHIRVLALTPIGYPAGVGGASGSLTPPAERKRKELGAIVHWDRW